MVAYINHQGGTHSFSLCQLTLDLLRWCRQRQILLSASHIAGDQSFSGLSFQGELPSIGMDSRREHLRPDLSIIRPAGSGPVCFGPQLPTSEVLCEDSGPAGVGSRRLFVPLGGLPRVRLSPVRHDSEGPREACRGSVSDSSSGPSVAKQAVVSAAVIPVSGFFQSGCRCHRACFISPCLISFISTRTACILRFGLSQGVGTGGRTF